MTVGLLFTDIEGSTRLLQRLGPAYADVLADHHALLRSAFASFQGTEQGNEGDSFFVTFAGVAEALAAALTAQRALSAHTWPAGVVVRVRMGVHVGEIQTVAGTLVGMSVHEAARISAAAHGGQVLVSASAAALVDRSEATWRDLGEHHLKDIGEPIQLFQVTPGGLPDAFPPLRVLRGGLRNNLPAQASSFIGRTLEVAQVDELVHASRLVTVTGAGGAGKSRIALRVAADQGDRFPDGVWFADLAPVSHDAAVGPEIARALGFPDSGREDLGAAIEHRGLLLLVDNCEHLVTAVGDLVTHLLRSCPALRVLATSREPLGIQGEVVWRVPSLGREDAVELFSARARAVSSGFDVTDENRAAVEEVCERLDAIPLALELAAARLGSLSVEQLARRLDQRFRLLAGGASSSMARQRTLQATVDWSYDLLGLPAQETLRRLGAFTGGFTLEAAEAVCGDRDPVGVLDLVDELVTKSLVVAEEHGDAVRYRLLETIRHYALDRLLQAGELGAARHAHLRWLEQLALEAEPHLWFGTAEAEWLDRLDLEDGNVRAGIEWALEEGDAGTAGSILWAVGYWLIARSRSGEGVAWARRVRAAAATDVDRALAAVGEMCFASNADALEPEMISRVREGVGALEASSRPWAAALGSAYAAAWSYDSGDAAGAAEAIPACERAVRSARGMAPGMVGLILQPLMWVYKDAGRLDDARTCGEEALALTSGAGVSVGQSRMSTGLSRLAIDAGDLDAAWCYAERAVEVARATGDTFVVIVGTGLLARVAEDRGQWRTARDLLLSILDSVADTQPADALEAVRDGIERCARRAAVADD